ncbi:MAG: glycosyl hydrolase [Alphaproteobacteria bacterium]|nr:glycosyl hydrolase [Alphaproteobacteria bacterium]
MISLRSLISRVSLSAALLVAPCVVGQAGATETTLGDRPAVISAHATEALLLGVARAGSRLVAVGEYGDVVLSDDDGKTWRQAKSVPTQVTLTAVTFVDDKNGWAVGHDTVILHTADGGETWDKEFGGGQSDNALLTVAFWNPNHGIAMGAFNFTAETKDGGKTWIERKTLNPIQKKPEEAAALSPGAGGPGKPAAGTPADDGAGAESKDPYAAATGDENHLNAAFMGPDGAMYVAAEAGAVFRSFDEGATWDKILTGYGGSFWGGLVANDGTLYITGMRGNVWHSTDKGATWTKLDTDGADQSIAMGLQLKDGKFVFVGLGGQVLYSDDGQKFVLTYREDRKGLNAVIQDGAQELLVFGETGVKMQPTTPPADQIAQPLPQG